MNLQKSSHPDFRQRAPWLANGVNGFTDAAGKFVCTGARMGRRDIKPDDYQTVRQILVERVPSLDRDYDKGGAYWGDVRGLNGNGAIWCAWGDSDTEQAEVFFRAKGKRDAKRQALAAFPGATIVSRNI